MPVKLKDLVSEMDLFMGIEEMRDSSLTICEGDEETALYIKQRIGEYNRECVAMDRAPIVEPLYLTLRDDSGQVVGGITATFSIYWGRCHIDILWVEERFRKSGYGSQLLQYVEQIAQTKGCKLSQLETCSFQAPEFYLKNGYEIFGILDNFPEGHTQYFLKKLLDRK